MSMTPDDTSPAFTTDQLQESYTWWQSLSPEWQRAFNEVMRQSSTTDQPDDTTLFNLQHMQIVRFAGPTAPFPNMSFELNDLSGLKGMKQLKIVIVIHHRLENLQDIAASYTIESLFLHNTYLTNVIDIAALVNLKELYMQANLITSLEPLQHLTQLHTLYCNYNSLTSLTGIGEQHRSQLKKFVCLPNDQLPDSEIIRMEREIGIRCLKG